VIESIRIGLLREVAGDTAHDHTGNAIRLVINDVNARGGLHGRPIELVVRVAGRGDLGTQESVRQAVAAWDALVRDEGVLALIGPATTPCAIAVHPRVESTGIPAIHWADTDEACGEWHFQFQAGCLPEEGLALAFLFARRSHRRVACFRGEGPYGEAYLRPFLRAAEALGIEVAAEFAIPPTATDVRQEVEAARRSGAEAMVAMGLFGVGLSLARAIREAGWEVACYGNCGFALGAAHSEARRLLAGWIATDLFDPHNRTTQAFLERYERRYGVRPASAAPAFGHDLATLMVEGIRRAPELSRAGLRRGLEAVRDLPAATGGAGRRMGFSSRDRLALKGPRLFLFQRITPEGLELVPA
jgi:ABC-type branched-subunit amino acid transport system substrate-binding protein